MNLLVFALAAASALPLTALAQTCENTDFKPRVLIIGENHCDPSSVERKTEALDLAKQGQILLVMENLFDGNSTSRIQGQEVAVGKNSSIRGMESEILHGLVISYMTGIEFRHACFSDKVSASPSGGLDETQVKAAVTYMRVNPLVKKMWLELAPEVRTAEDLGDTELYMRGLKEVAAMKMPTSAAIARVYRMMNPKLIEWARTDKAASAIAGHLLALQPDDQAQGFNNMARGRSTPALDAARDAFFSAAIKSFYCEAAAQKKNMVVVMGNFHVSGVMSDLPESWNDGTVTAMQSDRDPLKIAEWNGGLKGVTLTEDQMRRTQQVAMAAAEAIRFEKLPEKTKESRMLANKFKARTMIFINHARSTGLSDEQMIAYARDFLLGRDVTRIEVTNSIVVAEADVPAVVELIESIAKATAVSK